MSDLHFNLSFLSDKNFDWTSEKHFKTFLSDLQGSADLRDFVLESIENKRKALIWLNEKTLTAGGKYHCTAGFTSLDLTAWLHSNNNNLIG